jgi:hypothetical protein
MADTGVLLRASRSFNNALLTEKVRPNRMIKDGTLVFHEPTNSQYKQASVPANAAGATVVIRNLARKEAAALTGGAESAMDSLLTIGTSNTPQSFKAALTAKGAIQGIISQVNHNNANQGAKIEASTWARDYMYAHAAGTWIFWRIFHVDRQQTSAVEINAMLAYTNTTTGNTNGLMALTSITTRPSSAPQMISRTILPGYDQPGFGLQIVVCSGFSGTVPASASQLSVFMGLWGTPIGLSSSSFFQNKQQSWTLNVAAAEHLEASGSDRTVEDAVAEIIAYFNKETATGGLYADDEYLNPATELP